MPTTGHPIKPGRTGRTARRARRGCLPCHGQLLLLLPVTRDAHGRFTRYCTGLPVQVLAVRRDAHGRFTRLAPARCTTNTTCGIPGEG
jgi:hypothetical protein